uniref:EF-hand domain-containing protein n=1 Tax=Haptolina brevifila TaxID=156173 RepID=A0A7S2JFX7_9EUKA
MRDVEGLQTEPAYPTMGFVLCRGRGLHVLLDKDEPPEVLQTCATKKSDGVYLELGTLQPEPLKYVIIPYTETPDVEHEYAMTLYTDYEVELEKVDPTKVLPPCIQCTDPKSFAKVGKALKSLEAKYATLAKKEQELRRMHAFGKPQTPALLAASQQTTAASQQPPAEQPASQCNSGQCGSGASGHFHQGRGAAAAAGAGYGAGAVSGGACSAGVDANMTAADVANFSHYFHSVDTSNDGFISAAELKRATLAVEQQHALEDAEYATQAREARAALATGAAELKELQQMLQQKREAKARAQVAPLPRGGRRTPRNR